MSSLTVKMRKLKDDGRFDIAVKVQKDAPVGERGFITLTLNKKTGSIETKKCPYEVVPNVGVTYLNKEMPNVVAKFADYDGENDEKDRWDVLTEEKYIANLSHEDKIKKASYTISKVKDQHIVIINSRFPYYEHVKYNLFKNKLGREAFDNKVTQYFINYATVNIVNPFFSQQEADNDVEPSCLLSISKKQHKDRSDLFFYICHQAMVGAKEELAK